MACLILLITFMMLDISTTTTANFVNVPSSHGLSFKENQDAMGQNKEQRPAKDIAIYRNGNILTTPTPYISFQKLLEMLTKRKPAKGKVLDTQTTTHSPFYSLKELKNALQYKPANGDFLATQTTTHSPFYSIKEVRNALRYKPKNPDFLDAQTTTHSPFYNLKELQSMFSKYKIKLQNKDFVHPTAASSLKERFVVPIQNKTVDNLTKLPGSKKFLDNSRLSSKSEHVSLPDTVTTMTSADNVSITTTEAAVVEDVSQPDTITTMTSVSTVDNVSSTSAETAALEDVVHLELSTMASLPTPDDVLNNFLVFQPDTVTKMSSLSTVDNVSNIADEAAELEDVVHLELSTMTSLLIPDDVLNNVLVSQPDTITKMTSLSTVDNVSSAAAEAAELEDVSQSDTITKMTSLSTVDNVSSATPEAAELEDVSQSLDNVSSTDVEAAVLEDAVELELSTIVSLLTPEDVSNNTFVSQPDTITTTSVSTVDNVSNTADEAVVLEHEPTISYELEIGEENISASRNLSTWESDPNIEPNSTNVQNGELNNGTALLQVISEDTSIKLKIIIPVTVGSILILIAIIVLCARKCSCTQIQHVEALINEAYTMTNINLAPTTIVYKKDSKDISISVTSSDLTGETSDVKEGTTNLMEGTSSKLMMDTSSNLMIESTSNLMIESTSNLIHDTSSNLMEGTSSDEKDSVYENLKVNFSNEKDSVYENLEGTFTKAKEPVYCEITSSNLK